MDETVSKFNGPLACAQQYRFRITSRRRWAIRTTSAPGGTQLTRGDASRKAKASFILRASQLRGDWRRIVRLAVGAILVVGHVAMAAAAFGQSINYSNLESIYNTGEVGYAAGGRDLKVLVRGNPFASQGVSDEQLARVIVDSMRGTSSWFVTNYTTTPNETARELYRVVWLIGVAKNTSIYAICRGVPGDISADGNSEGTSAGRTVLAALCRRERIMSYLGGSLGNIASVDDPQFKDFIKLATRQLFPRRDPNRSGGRNERRRN